MSCGNPHDTDCSEVLALVYEFLDGETTDAFGEAQAVGTHRESEGRADFIVQRGDFVAQFVAGEHEIEGLLEEKQGLKTLLSVRQGLS